MTIQQLGPAATDPHAFSASVPLPPAPESNQNDKVGREVIPGYRLIEPIGAGGYGEVWKAEAPGGLAKAVKLVFGLSGEKRAAEERKSLLRIKDVRHPFLLSLERIEIVDNQLIVVTELADGSLKDRFEACVIAGNPGIPRAELLRYLAEAADVLDFMTSEHGLQHLDIKPENLLLVGGHIKVADFGLVKNVHDVSASIVAGLTPMFAAPESFDGRPSDRSDQYSLAIVYQQLLTGRGPFNGQTLAQLAAQHLNGRPDLNSLPEADRPVIERALAKDPFDRFPSCRAMVERLAGSTSATPYVARSTEAVTVSRRPLQRVTADLASRNEFKTEVIDVKLAPTRQEARPSETVPLPASRSAAVVDLPPLQLDRPNEFRPTLFVGLGGCGAKALRILAETLQVRFGSLAELPAIGTLLIDTDYEGFSAEFGRGQSGLLDERQFIYAPLKPTQYYRGRADDLLSWLSRRWIYNIPKCLKTEGIRPLGRLALVDHVRQIDQRLSEELNSICSEAALAKSSQTLGQVVHANPRVCLVGSISSGTGGGMVWDMTQLIHQTLRQRAVQPIEIVTVLAHWACSTATEKELAIVNACSSLRELQHYVVEGCPGDSSCQLPPLGRHHGVFDNTYVVNFGTQASEIGARKAAESLARYLSVDLSPWGNAFTSSCRRPSLPTDRTAATMRTFGLAKIDHADLLAVEDTARELVLHAAERGQAASDPLLQELAQIFDSEDQNRNGELRLILSSSPSEIPAAARQTLDFARRRLLETLVEQNLESLDPAFLACGGSRRFLIVASPEMQRAGLVELIQRKLPAPATIAEHSSDELVVLCEAWAVSVREAALDLVRERPDLLELVARMPTRCDVPWMTL